MDDACGEPKALPMQSLPLASSPKHVPIWASASALSEAVGLPPLALSLDEYCVVGEVKIGPSVVPTKGSADGPSRAYPTVGPPGRGRNRLVLPSRRRLLPT